jgi:hypothetical protein
MHPQKCIPNGIWGNKKNIVCIEYLFIFSILRNPGYFSLKNLIPWPDSIS